MYFPSIYSLWRLCLSFWYAIQSLKLTLVGYISIHSHPSFQKLVVGIRERVMLLTYTIKGDNSSINKKDKNIFKRYILIFIFWKTCKNNTLVLMSMIFYHFLGPMGRVLTPSLNSHIMEIKNISCREQKGMYKLLKKSTWVFLIYHVFSL